MLHPEQNPPVGYFPSSSTVCNKSDIAPFNVSERIEPQY